MILLCRGLLSGAVMFDMDAPAGDFGLVMCSGYGPMFPAADGSRAERQADAGMSMDMSMPMPMPMTDHATIDQDKTGAVSSVMPDGMPMHATADANDICAFSAALLLGIGALFVVLLLVGALSTVRRLRIRYVRIVAGAPSPFALPLSRAPPSGCLPA
ncbi:hypothetical protein [Robbsia sp. KACC 23696]|uniref:hypothetical protein n=1 Tax=Robbsia sp. KACC 23696 TaxID=3149231 RepID=UPI00325BDBD3